MKWNEILKDDFLKIKPFSKDLQPSVESLFILREARRRNIKIEYIKNTDFIILSTRKTTRTLRIDRNALGYSYHAIKILSSKQQTKAFLQRNDISVCQGQEFSPTENQKIIRYFDRIRKPVVVKPAASTCNGESVYMNISSKNQLEKVLDKLVKLKYPSVVIEEQFSNAPEYRILATREKVCGIINRVPANVIGDGKHTIKELVEIKNSDYNRGDEYIDPKPLWKIIIDDIVLDHLEKQGLTLNTVIEKDKKVFLRANSNAGAGGDTIDYTDKVHPSVNKLALKVINSIPELPYAGIDLLSKDITKKQTKDSYVIIELNTDPGLRIHYFPMVGKCRNVAKDIIDINFPETKN